MTVEHIVNLLLAVAAGGAGTALISLYRSRAQNRLDNSAGRVNDAKAWDTLVTTLERRMVAQEHTVDLMQQENAELDGYIHKLQDLLEKNEIEAPPFTHRKRKE